MKRAFAAPSPTTGGQAQIHPAVLALYQLIGIGQRGAIQPRWRAFQRDPDTARPGLLHRLHAGFRGKCHVKTVDIQIGVRDTGNQLKILGPIKMQVDMRTRQDSALGPWRVQQPVKSRRLPGIPRQQRRDRRAEMFPNSARDSLL